jgi:hypothetical protein
MSKYGHNKSTKKAPGWNVQEPKVRSEISNRERVDLNPESFDRLIQQKGVMAKVYRTLYCPNVKSVDGAEHEIDCTICNGSGFLDVDPICTYVFIQHQELNELPAIEGFVDGNTVLMTFQIGVEVQYFTKIELQDFKDVFPQRVMRKPGSLIDVLKYPACIVNGLFTGSNAGLVRYYQNTDFAVDLNGNIKWLTPGDAQLVGFSLVPDSGTFKLKFGLLETADIAFGASAAQVQAALRLIQGLEAVTVSGDFTAGFTVTFIGVDSPVSLLTSTSALLNGVTAVTIAISDRSKAARKPNDGQPYTIHYQAHTQYRTKAAAHTNRFTQFATGSEIQHMKMPDQWYAQKEFLVKRTDKETGAELQQGPFSRHTITDTTDDQND